MDEQDVRWETFPLCRRCDQGHLVPLSDYGGQGAEVRYKAWVCTNPVCGFNVKIRNGEIVRDEPVNDASARIWGRGIGAAGAAGSGPRRTRPVALPDTDGVGRSN
jgi:hypothetical protein